MIRLYLFHILIHILSYFRFFKNDINNFGETKLINILKHSIYTISLNIFIIFPIGFYPLLRYNVINPEFIFIEILVNYFIYDFVYYFIHRQIQFSWIHEKRHEIPIVSFSSTYAGIIDYFLLDIFSVYIGLFIMKAHLFTYYFFIGMETYINILTHSKKGHRTQFYLLHRYYWDCNYGINMISDKYLKTFFPS